MKLLYKLLLLVAVFQFFSCKKDTTTISYAEKEVISVKGMDDIYPINIGQKLNIDPQVTSNKDADFDYVWGIYETNVQGYTPVLDTIGHSKQLDYTIIQPAKDWFLVLKVTNKKTGFSDYFTSTVRIGTEYTRGWYVIKDENNMTDMDFFLTPQSITPTTIRENVYSLINGRKLDGNAVMLRFFTDYKAPIAGTTTYANTRSLFLMSEKDAAVVNLSTLKDIRNFNSMFYGVPAVKHPTMVGNDFLVYFMVNDGQLHSIIGQGPSTGIFGGRKINTTLDLPYYLSKYHIMFISSYFFDELSSSFYSATDRSLYLSTIKDNPATQLPANNNNKKLIYMGTKTTAPLAGFAIFQDKTDPASKILASVSPNVNSFRMTYETLSPTDKVYNGSNYALLFTDENMMYFSVGNEVWSRNLSNKFEQLQYTVPAGETITFIRHRKATGTGVEAAYAYNYVMIGTKSGGNYKIRMFTKTSGNLAADPVFTLEGKGSATDAVYVGPSITTNMIYPSTY